MSRRKIMFVKACKSIREGIYGVLGSSVIQQGNKQNISITNATAFMVAEKYLVTAGHFVHQENNPSKPVHQKFEVIRAPEIGNTMENAKFLSEDKDKDLALLEIINPRNSTPLKLLNEIVPRGTTCGFLGFPLASVTVINGRKQFSLFERFQGAHISNFYNREIASGVLKPFYEVDNFMYGGSSGCPCFNKKGEVIGMQDASVMQKRDGQEEEKLAISLATPSVDIIKFVENQHILGGEQNGITTA